MHNVMEHIKLFAMYIIFILILLFLEIHAYGNISIYSWSFM